MMPSPPLTLGANAGFTLIEMLIVLTILGFTAAIAMPVLTAPSNGTRLRVTARELLSALRHTRAAAVTRQTPMDFMLDVDARSMASPVVPEKKFSSDITVAMVIADAERLPPARGAFRFFADGSSTGGDIRLLLAGLETRICVNWLTGQVRENDRC